MMLATEAEDTPEVSLNTCYPSQLYASMHTRVVCLAVSVYVLVVKNGGLTAWKSPLYCNVLLTSLPPFFSGITVQVVSKAMERLQEFVKEKGNSSPSKAGAEDGPSLFCNTLAKHLQTYGVDEWQKAWDCIVIPFLVVPYFAFYRNSSWNISESTSVNGEKSRNIYIFS